MKLDEYIKELRRLYEEAIKEEKVEVAMELLEKLHTAS